MARRYKRKLNRSLLIALDDSINNLKLNSKEIEQVLEKLIAKTKEENIKLTKEELSYIQLAINNINERLDKLTEDE